MDEAFTKTKPGVGMDGTGVGLRPWLDFEPQLNWPRLCPGLKTLLKLHIGMEDP